MLDTTLQLRLRMLGMNPKLASAVARKIRDEYSPAAAVVNKVYRDPASPLGCACLGALGINMTSAKSTASLASTGASIGSTVATAMGVGSAVSAGATAGSIVPGIGTVIGAAVGVAVAVALHAFRNKDVRVSGGTKGQCLELINQYVQAASAAGPTSTIGPQMGLDNLEKLNWCINAYYGQGADPRYFSISWQWGSEYAKQLVKAAFTLPPGSRWTSTAITGKTTDNKHSYIRPAVTVTLPKPTTLNGLGDLIDAFELAGCIETSGPKYSSMCAPIWTTSVAKRMFMDLVGFEINRQFPAVFKPPVAKITPAVVKAAASVIAKTASKTIVNPATGKLVVVPVVSPGLPNGYVATGNPNVDAIGTQMADDGIDMNSAQAKQVLADVAAEGVIKTPAGPKAPMQAGMGIAAVVLMGLVFLGSKKHGSH